MKTNLIYPLILFVVTTSIAATAKCILDVAQQEIKIESQKEMIIEIRDDVRWIKGRMK